MTLILQNIGKLFEPKFKNLDELLEDIGLGNRMAQLVARRISPDAERDSEIIAIDSQVRPLAIRGTEGMVINFAKCCRPIPGDHIIGHLSSGRGIVVHVESCRNITDLREKPEKCLPINWANDVEGEYTVELRIELESQRGLLALIASVITEADANLESINMEEKDAHLTVINLYISVRHRVHLANLIKKLRKLSAITRITRSKS